MSAHEIFLGMQFLDSTLRNDAQLMALLTGGLYRGTADEGTQPPYGVFAFQAGSDTTTMNGVRLLVSALFQVKAIGSSDETLTLAQAAERIDQLLGGPPNGPVSGSVTGGYIAACYRQSPIWIDEPPIEGEQWTDIGGLYRLQIEQTS